MSNPYEGDSVTTLQPGLTGRNTAASAGPGLAAGVLGASAIGEGVHGETNSTQYAAVAGIELNPSSNIAAVYGEQRGNGPGVYGIAKGQGHGVFGHSATGEGVHGETNSTQYAAIAGIELNPSSNIAAVYGEQRGNGPGVYGIAKGNGAGVFGTSTSGLAGQFQGDVQITGRLTVQGKDFEDRIATLKKILTNLNSRTFKSPSEFQFLEQLIQSL